MGEEFLSQEPTDTPKLTTEDLTKKDADKEPPKSPDQLMVEALKDYPFITYLNGTIKVEHAELKQFLKPVILKVGALVDRGTILARLNGGATNIDQQTQGINGMIATALVGFEGKLNVDLLTVEDTDLIFGLYLAVVSYNNFFRKTPLGFIL